MHTEADFYEYVTAAANAAGLGIIVYNTFWTKRPCRSEWSSGWSRIPAWSG